VTVPRFLFQLTLVLLTGWLLAYWPAGILHQASGIFWLTVAAGIMFLSGISGLILVRVLKQHNTLAETFLHSANRALWVVMAVIVIRTTQPQLGFSEFYGWLIFFYLQLLIVEVLALRRQSRFRRNEVA
jgi:hypothetical protein